MSIHDKATDLSHVTVTYDLYLQLERMSICVDVFLKKNTKQK